MRFSYLRTRFRVLAQVMFIVAAVSVRLSGIIEMIVVNLIKKRLIQIQLTEIKRT